MEPSCTKGTPTEKAPAFVQNLIWKTVLMSTAPLGINSLERPVPKAGLESFFETRGCLWRTHEGLGVRNLHVV